MQVLRPLVKTVEQVPRRVRDLARLQQVAQILWRHGFGILVAELDIAGLQRFDRTPFDSTPERAAQALRELGPTFVKLGQVLSTRPDLVPDDYLEALQKLQDDAGPMPWAQVEEALVRELGAEWRGRLASIDETPIATASIAQVHGAVLPDGREVVLKVQRPGLEHVIQSDLAILRFLAQRAQVEFPELGSADLEGMLREFETSILGELDFEAEARNQRRCAENFAGDERIKIPDVIDALSGRRVLCMERLRGVKITDARAAGFDMVAVGNRALGVVYDMLFTHGYFHADAHPGNVFILPDGRVGLIDFGMMGRLTEEMRNDVIFIVWALQRGDWRTIARLYYEIAIKTRRVDYRAIERDTVEVMEQHWSGRSIREMQLGPYAVDLARRAAKHGARMPPEYTMFFKALVTVEGLAKTVVPEVDPIAAARPYFEAMLRERLDPARWTDDLTVHALTLSSILRRLPVSLSQLLDDLDAQRLRLDVRHVVDEAAEAGRERRTNRLVASLLAVGAAACGTAGLFVEATWGWGVPILSVVFYGIAVLAGAGPFLRVVTARG